MQYSLKEYNLDGKGLTLKNLKKENIVKITYYEENDVNCESFYVWIEKISNEGEITGIIANNLITKKLKIGEKITFNKKHIKEVFEKKLTHKEIMERINKIKNEKPLYVLKPTGNTTEIFPEKMDEEIMNLILKGNECKEKEDYENMKKYYTMALEKVNNNTMYDLAEKYFEKEDYDNMEKILLIGIEKGDITSMNNLAYYFYKIKDYVKMEKYLLMAIEKGDCDAMYNLGNYYYINNDFENMKKYYWMAIEKNSYNAILCLLNYHMEKEPNTFKLMEKLFKLKKQFIEKGIDKSLEELLTPYKESKPEEYELLKELSKLNEKLFELG